MGNTMSISNNTKPKKNKRSLVNVINFIASDYILTQTLNDLRKLYDHKYCDNLVKLTSKILSDKLNDREIKYLSDKINGNKSSSELNKEKVLYIDNKHFNPSINLSSSEKKKLCIDISAFYIKVAHIFASIVGVINPKYKYINKNGKNVELSIFEITPDNYSKYNISNITNPDITIDGLCYNKINYLKKNSTLPTKSKTKPIIINPSYCNINKPTKNKKFKSLIDEPGLAELEQLYFDKYDYKIGAYTSMKSNTKTQYLKDLSIFYKTFLNKNNMPSDITKFSDIKLNNYADLPDCKSGKFKKTIGPGTLREKLFAKYALHLRNMIRENNKKQNKLVDILNKLFIKSVNPNTGISELSINNNINDKKILDISEKVREYIKDIYVSCENNYNEGINIYKAIIETLLFEGTLEQVKEQKNTKQRVKNNPIQNIQYNNIKDEFSPIKQISDNRNKISNKPLTQNKKKRPNNHETQLLQDAVRERIRNENNINRRNALQQVQHKLNNISQPATPSPPPSRTPQHSPALLTSQHSLALATPPPPATPSPTPQHSPALASTPPPALASASARTPPSPPQVYRRIKNSKELALVLASARTPQHSPPPPLAKTPQHSPASVVRTQAAKSANFRALTSISGGSSSNVINIDGIDLDDISNKKSKKLLKTSKKKKHKKRKRTIRAKKC